MIRVEAPTLEEAFAKASTLLSCSVSELKCEVIQNPTKGILGLFKKNAIIVAINNMVKDEIVVKEKSKKSVVSPSIKETKSVSMTKKEELKQKEKITPPKKEIKKEVIKKEVIIDNFFEADNKEEAKEEIVYDELALLIENQLKELLSHACFHIDVIEVDVRDNTALIFIDGDDAALLIGKEGYRYNALSYMIFNWLNSKYELFIKLEIAEFLVSQNEMIKAYIQPVIETVEKTGRGKTRFLDGILVQLALEQLRAHFPNKYVAIKKTKNGKRFVVINEFNSKPHAK